MEPSPTVNDSELRAWSRLARRPGVTGLLTMVVLFSAIIAVSSAGEPPLDAPSEDALRVLR